MILLIKGALHLSEVTFKDIYNVGKYLFYIYWKM